MPIQLPQECAELLASQGNVIARGQSQLSGVGTQRMSNALRNGDWRYLQRGVYAPFTGDPPHEARLWAALLRAGDGATLSHQTAAERHGLVNSSGEIIHVTVPARRNPAKRGKIPGVVVHRSDSIAHTRHPAMSPPCTRVEDTVLDLIAAARTFDEAYRWITRAVGSRRTTAERLRGALDARARFRWRRDIELALGEAGSGIHSWLELQYVRRVERPHGLPPAQRQTRVRLGTKNAYLDNLYTDFGVCVELDGTAAHPAAEQWRDKRRDNCNLAWEGTQTLRFGFIDLYDRARQCGTAAMVTALLLRQGLPATLPRPCTPTCPVAPVAFHDRGAFYALSAK